jgi:hypothetical protein
MWEDIDKYHFTKAVNEGKGQICNDNFSKLIELHASDLNNKTFLEIGTWNGLGSTKAFVNGLSKRNDNYIFYSLECNSDKANQAKELYKNYDKVHILNEVIWNSEPNDFYDIFPQCKTNELYKKWNDVDIINMKNCNLFLERNNLPDFFDILLLDGGEFTTYYEFQLLKNKCKILMLDDTNTDKCKLIVNEIKENPQLWEIIIEEKIRNGYLIAVNIDTLRKKLRENTI